MMMLCWLLLTLLLLFIPVRGRFQTAVVLPHGDVAVDPSLVPTSKRAAAIALGAAQTAAKLTVNHDRILVSTPHGIALSNDWGIYVGDVAAGEAVLGQDESNVTTHTVRVQDLLLDASAASGMVKHLQQVHNVSTISLPDPTTPMPLYWAEVIPLLLVPRQSDRKHVILTHPLRRHAHAVDMVDELLDLGHALAAILDHDQKHDWAVLVSGDLSHTHRTDGPYGYSNASAPFDEAVGAWADSHHPCSTTDFLLQTARRLQPRAMSCAFTGLVLLHGMLCGNDQFTVSSQQTVNTNVSYFGMMAAQFSRIPRVTETG